MPSAVEESLAGFSDTACVSNFERCLDFARHDKERRLRPAFGIERRIGKMIDTFEIYELSGSAVSKI
jgi:hypothetical protein